MFLRRLNRPARRLLAAGALGLSSFPASAQAPGPGGEAPPTPVAVVTVQPQDVTLTATLPGRVVASGLAEVRPQVDGIIVERLFDEGSLIDLGDPLYRIDDASYRAQVAAARAQVAQAEAQLRAAEREETRFESLIERNVASQQTYDEAVAARDSAQAAVAVAKADLQAAVIDLDRTTIRAPLAGVIGRSVTTEGALVTAGQGEPLATIRQLDPVLVDVTQSAAELLDWRRGHARERLEDAEQRVALTLADGMTYRHRGLLRAAEPYVNEQTGVVTLRLQFPNPDRLLLPGMYVQVEMPQGVARDVILAPMEGVSRDRRGRPTALVVNEEGLVEERVLTIIEARGSDWVVSDGLKGGDRIIVEGLQKVRPGAPVAPEERASADAPAAGDSESPTAEAAE